jgi:ubiquinone/menaquinone biosynthesis C-methylase UbiE
MNRILRLLLRTVGKLSHGIQLGWQTGFGSGVMLEYVYENKPRGITPLGVWIDRIFLSHPVWESERSRRALLVKQLQQAVSHYERPQIFDLAAGTGSYLFGLRFDQALITAGDYDAEAVEQGEQRARVKGRTDIKFKWNNAFNLDEFAAHQADILVCAGFFDVLTLEQQIQTVLENGSAITQPNARWIFTTQEKYPDLKLLKESLADLSQKTWELVPRSAWQLVRWAKPYGWELETLQRNQYFAVGTLIRTYVPTAGASANQSE